MCPCIWGPSVRTQLLLVKNINVVVKTTLSQLELRLKQLSQEYFDRYTGLVTRLCTNELNNWQINAPEFTDHGIGHCKRVIERLNQLISDNILHELNKGELYVLLSSVWLHDIGMMCKQIGEEKFEAKEIRERHHELTKKYLLNDNKYREYNIFSEPEANIIADICYCHRKTSIPSTCDARVALASETIHLRFLSALLRLADTMDMDYRRASECTMDLIKVRGDSVEYWKACQLVTGIACETQNSTIELFCTIRDDEERRIATSIARKLNEERGQTVPYFEFGLKYDFVKCRLRDSVECFIVLNNVSEQFFQQTYRKNVGETAIFKPTIPIETLRLEFEQFKGENK